MRQKVFLLLMTGLLTAGTVFPAYAAESTIELKAGTTIISKGNPGAEGLSQDYVVLTHTDGSSMAIKKGKSLKSIKDGTYKVKGEYSIDSSTKPDEDVDCKLPKILYDRLDTLSKKQGISGKEALRNAVEEYCDTNE